MIASMKHLLGITHTDRAFDLSRCSLNFLQRRYEAPDRLSGLPPFESLADAESHQPHDGSATFWIFDSEAPDRLRLVRHFDPGYKVQHAVFANGRFVLAGHEFIEVLDADGAAVARISDPWMSGVHTCFAHDGRIVVSASGSDAVLIVDPAAERVVEAFRMPEAIYGRNYPLARTDDTRSHFIDNDRQLTHINSAWPAADGIYVSTLIEGAVGRFGWDGTYEEIVRGFWGCHGVRKLDDERLLFSDSCLGCACVLDAATRRLVRRFDFGSRWLHDTETPDGRFFFGGLGDLNCVVVLDAADSSIVGQWPMSKWGAGVQFMSVCALPAQDVAWLDDASQATLRAAPLPAPGLVGAASPGQPLWKLEPRSLVPQEPARAIMRGGMLDVTTGSEPFAYAVATRVRGCDPGLYDTYTLTLDATLREGGFSVGILDAQTDSFACSTDVRQPGRHRHELFWTRRAMPAWFRIVISNHEPDARASSFRLHEVVLAGRGDADETSGDADAFFAPEVPHRYTPLWSVDLAGLRRVQAQVTPADDGALRVLTPPSTALYALVSPPRTLDLSAYDELCLQVDATVEEGGLSAMALDSRAVRELPAGEGDIFAVSGVTTETQRRRHEFAAPLRQRPGSLTVVISNFSPEGRGSAFVVHGITVAGRSRPF